MSRTTRYNRLHSPHLPLRRSRRTRRSGVVRWSPLLFHSQDSAQAILTSSTHAKFPYSQERRSDSRSVLHLPSLRSPLLSLCDSSPPIGSQSRSHEDSEIVSGPNPLLGQIIPPYRISKVPGAAVLRRSPQRGGRSSRRGRRRCRASLPRGAIEAGSHLQSVAGVVKFEFAIEPCMTGNSAGIVGSKPGSCPRTSSGKCGRTPICTGKS